MSTARIPVAKFRMGRIVAPPNALAHLTEEDILLGIRRHQAGDWGDLDAEDRVANETALAHGGRLLSAYHADNGTRFWLITEHDRSVSTVLLPEDY